VDVDGVIREHYGGDDLEEVVLGALARAGVDVANLGVDDLARLDQFHVGARAATEHVLERLDLGPASELLDVGCGIGGPARLAARRHGCRVTGIDLSEDFVAVARSLDERVGLADHVAVEAGSAVALPYGDGTFDRAMLLHVGMNLPDKAAAFAEVRRVLRPGSVFAVYDQMRVADGDLTFPLPWAASGETSFLERRPVYAELLVAAGFAVEADDDLLGTVVQAGSAPAAPIAPSGVFGPRRRVVVRAVVRGALARRPDGRAPERLSDLRCDPMAAMRGIRSEHGQGRS
jgi:MPBQ/MSBQ methyltransferase